MENKSTVTLFILVVISLICYFPLFFIPVTVYDEGIILVGAERILQGQVPYRDYWTIYAPGQFYTLAILFKIFGISLTVERAYDIVVKLLMLIVIFKIFRKLTTLRIAVSAWIASLIWIGSMLAPAYPVYPALLFIYIASYFFLCCVQSPDTYRIIPTAAAVFIACIFRHDLGGIAAICIGGVLMLRTAEISRRPIAVYAGTIFCLGVPFIGYFAFAADISIIFKSLIVFPATVFPQYRSLPYPMFLSFHTLPFWLFPLVLISGLAVSVYRLYQKDSYDAVFTYGLLLISISGIFFLHQAAVRSDTLHLFPAGLNSILVFFLLVHDRRKYPFLRFPITHSVGIGISVLLGIVIFYQFYEKVQFEFLINRIYLTPHTHRAGKAYIPPDLDALITAIRRNIPEHEPIYVGVKNHDRFFINSVALYFLADRPCPTRYHELHPGHTTTRDTQTEMVRELQEASVRIIVLSPEFGHEPNLSDKDTHVDILDGYIAAHFKLYRRYGDYEVWIKGSRSF